MEFLIGGVAASIATIFTNPLEVIKTRLQLQGELKAKGLYTVHYKSFFRALYAVAKADGMLALQSGLVPAMWFQMCLNSIRLGMYHSADEGGWTRSDETGKISVAKSVAFSSLGGCAGAFVASPFYMVKTQLQAQAAADVAVGHQHDHSGMTSAFIKIFRQHGLSGLWRGSSAAMPRIAVGSPTQLVTFEKSKEFLSSYPVFQETPLLNTFVASMVGGTAVSVFMSPYDVVLTRLYNQGVDGRGRGLLYTGFIDCFKKTWHSEGMHGFYKGFVPMYARLGPQTVLCFLFWDYLKDLHKRWTNPH